MLIKFMFNSSEQLFNIHNGTSKQIIVLLMKITVMSICALFQMFLLVPQSMYKATFSSMLKWCLHQFTTVMIMMALQCLTNIYPVYIGCRSDISKNISSNFISRALYLLYAISFKFSFKSKLGPNYCSSWTEVCFF